MSALGRGSTPAGALLSSRPRGPRSCTSAANTSRWPHSRGPRSCPSSARWRGVEGVTEALAPISAASTCHGLVTSEGDTQLAAASARNAFNVEGTGVTVGVLSDSFDTSSEWATDAGDDVASGDLPGAGNPCDRTDPVEVLQDFTDTRRTDHRRGPGDGADRPRPRARGADIAFATAYPNEFAFAENIRRLASPVAAGGADAEILVDDIAYFEEPFFQDGPVGAAIEEVTGAGVAYFTAAGNDNLIDEEGNDIASWETPAYRDTACPPELETLGPFSRMPRLRSRVKAAKTRPSGSRSNRKKR